jgi:hypothetical protein
VARTGGGVAFPYLLISFFISTPIVWCKCTSTKAFEFASKEGTFFPFSLNLHFPLQEFLLHFPPSTYVLVELARFSM